jgi:glycosyl transferase, family 25
MNIPVYVINLKRSIERRNQAIEQLDELGVQFKIIEAVDGAEFSEQEIHNKKDFGFWKFGLRSRFLFKGEIGCVLSHLKIYQKMIDEDIELACILEDDIEYKKEFKDFLIFDNLNIVKWDLLFLGHRSQYSKKEALSIKKEELNILNYSLGEPLEIPVGSYGYIICKEAAKIILNNAYPIRMPLDYYIGNATTLGIRTYLISPPCISHNYKHNSTIYQNLNIVYTSFMLELLRRFLNKTNKWFPFIISSRIWINYRFNLSIAFLRKVGLLKNSYAKPY